MKKCHRRHGEEIAAFISRFEHDYRRAEAALGPGAHYTDTLLGHMFLKKVDIPAQLEIHLVSLNVHNGAHRFSYEGLKRHLRMTIPNVAVLKSWEGPGGRSGYHSGTRGRGGSASEDRKGRDHGGRRRFRSPSPSHEVHATASPADERATTSEDDSCTESLRSSAPEELCEPEEVLVTMAKKARNDVVKARSFYRTDRKSPSREQSDRHQDGIEKLNQKLPCKR